MARIRSLKPEFWQDEKLVVLSDATRLIFLGLISLADDCGRLLDKPVKIEADLFDGSKDRRADVHEALATLSRIGRIRRGKTASGQRIIEIVNWRKHQRVDHPNVKAAFPEIVDVIEDTEIRESFANHSRGIPEAFAHHINDQRPTTSTNDQNHCAPRKRVATKAAVEKAWPLFGQDERGRCITAFRKLGTFEPARIIKAVAPFFRAPDDPAFVPHDKVAFAVEDYCNLIAKGKSAPYASPEDCGKKLGALAKNCVTYEWDALGRLDAQLLAIHGSTKLAA